uniref:NAC transcription factor 22 n=1 Tax=Litchi chinensis TaxID=151069 RepID=A0A8K1MBF5_LITCN|nr:NAC transcription factor 22 [Litchi chinensis]
MGPSIVGYRFHPTPEELINHYLRKKRLDPDFSVQKIKEVNLYDYEPSELAGLLPVEADEPEWHFFCEPEYKYGNSKRVNRRTRGGNWKVTGKKRDVKDKHKRVIGWKITLVFYEGSGNSREARTNWVMHEYHIKDDSGFKKEFVVVRIKINRNTKHKAPLTPNGGIPSPNMASNSGNHIPEKNALQVEWQLQQEPQPLANHEICFDGISQLLPNQSCSHNRDTQQVPDRVLYGNSQLLPNYSDQEEGQRRSQLAFQNEFCGQGTAHSHSLSKREDNGRKSQSAVQNEFYDQETGHAHSQSGREDDGRNSQLAVQNESSYGQETGHFYPLIELEDGGRNSLPAIHNESFGQGIGDSRLSDFSSKPVTGNSVYYDGDETIAALLNDSSAVTIDDLLNEFSSVANGDYDFNSLPHQSPITILSPRG